MSVWTTRSLEIDRKYIVLQHPIKGTNNVINGVKFRSGYAVVEKDSKTYFTLKRIPVLRASKEFPLAHLKSLQFITRISDIKTVYGQDVYTKFLNEELEHLEQIERAKKEVYLQDQKHREEELKLKEQIKQQIEEAKQSGKSEVVDSLLKEMPVITKCACKNINDTLCSETALEFSPSGYCNKHIIYDPKLLDFGIHTPNFMTKDETRKFRDKVKRILQEAKKSGKF